VSIEKKQTCNVLFACVSIAGRRSMHSTPTEALEVILMLRPLGIYIEGEVKITDCWRIYSSNLWPFGRFRKAEWPSLLAPGHKIIPIIAFERMFLVLIPRKSTWLSQKTSEI
jgi:hypothetical protein